MWKWLNCTRVDNSVKLDKVEQCPLYEQRGGICIKKSVQCKWLACWYDDMQVLCTGENGLGGGDHG